jgi:phage shock protein A
MGHAVKDRALEKRLDRATEEADRLRSENDRLRGEVEETRTEHHRILDMLETRLAAPEVEVEVEKGSHRGRWLMFLMAVGGGAYALIRMRSHGNGHDEWAGSHDSPAVTETGAAAI